MDNREFLFGTALVVQGGNGFSVSETPCPRKRPPATYDLDLLYVECRLCGNPVLWDHGKTSQLIQASGMDASLLDSECLILSEGCPQCNPDAGAYHLQVVRVAALSMRDIPLFAGEGNA